MTQLPALPPIEPWPLAANLSSAPEATPWTLVVGPAAHLDALAAEIAEQLESLFEGDVAGARVTSAGELFALVRQKPRTAVIIVGLEALDAAAWRGVDANRSRLARTAPAIVVLDEERLPLVVNHAPNLWSWLGGAVWRGRLEGEGEG